MSQPLTWNLQYARQIIADEIKLMRTWLLKEQVFIYNIHKSKAQIPVPDSSLFVTFKTLLK